MKLPNVLPRIDVVAEGVGSPMGMIIPNLLGCVSMREVSDLIHAAVMHVTCIVKDTKEGKK